MFRRCRPREICSVAVGHGKSRKINKLQEIREDRETSALLEKDRRMRDKVLDPLPRPQDQHEEHTVNGTIALESGPKKVMIIVAGRLFRDCIQRVVEGPDRTVIGRWELLDQVGRDTLPIPDLVIVGIGLDVGGADRSADEFCKIRKLRERMPSARWIVLSQRRDPGFLRDALETGVHGLLRADSSGDVLQRLVELVRLGYSFVPAEFGTLLGGDYQPSGNGAAAPNGAVEAAPSRTEALALSEPPLGPILSVQSSPVEPAPRADQSKRRPVSFSGRENEILRCLIAGASNKLIARELRIAEATVKVHVKALLRKMQVANRTQAAISALRLIGDTGRSGVVADLASASSKIEKGAMAMCGRHNGYPPARSDDTRDDAITNETVRAVAIS